MEAREWIEAVTGAALGGGSFHSTLRSGVVLGALVNQLRPGAATISTAIGGVQGSFVQRDNIGSYLKACAELGVQPHDSFQTADLFEGRDMTAVLVQIHALGRVAQKIGFDGPRLGAREATATPRVFSEEQRRDAQVAQTLMCVRLAARTRA